ncbi:MULTISPECIES: ABC transporter permease [Staphylococcaceae]|uniref:ABC transporter permease n=1 Tax=Staphylococcaceae TaxID=90964 RepID=UPI001865FBA6|nr:MULTISPECIES: FtsX-like permease family protein [Staphylococcaceae]
MKNILNILNISFKAIIKNKKRNIFTMIGIIIGIAAVITIMSLGNGFKETANKQFEGFGAGKNQITINYIPHANMKEKLEPFNRNDVKIAKSILKVKDAKIRYSKNSIANSLDLTLEKGATKKEVSKKVESALNKNGSQNTKGAYAYTDFEEISKNVNVILDAITYFIAAVAGISLFIAGVGVMNVMFISVAERTEEIAIRRAFGAKRKDIEIQFLTESIILCLVGGIIGLIFGVLISKGIDIITPKYITSVVTINSIILSVSISTIIGIVFGWVPARSATKKELIDIIK